MIENIKAFYHHRPWTGRFIITFLVLALLLSIVRMVLSPGIIYGTTSWLKKQGIEASIEAVNINIFAGTISLKNAIGHKNGKPLFNIGLVDLHWQWQPLSNRTIKVTKVALDSLNINIKQYRDVIIIGGINIPLSTATNITPQNPDKKKTDEKVKAWAASLGEVIFSNLNVCYKQSTNTLADTTNQSIFINYCVALKKLSWAGTISYARDAALLKADDIPLTSNGDFTLDGLDIIDKRLNKKLLNSKSTTLKNVSIAGINHLHIDQLKMDDLSLLQRNDQKHIDSLRFHQLFINDIKLSDLNTLSINNISIKEPGIYLVKQSSSNWEYQQWIPSFPESRPPVSNPKDKPATDKKTKFKLTLNNISIEDSDLCYLDSTQTLYYCLTFTTLDWKGRLQFNTTPLKSGTLNLQAKGDLDLLRSDIRNQTIDRSLFNFKKLTLTRLHISNGNAIALKTFKLDKLNALQRSDRANDNTASFESLAIDDIKYSGNKITINTILLKGLASSISKNKDGRWEYDKWLATNPSIKTKKEKPSATRKKPLIISLNDLDITTGNKIIFTDNSTQPVMKIGLSGLTFDVKDIDTSKPNSNSRFKFYAKTTRHGTINLEGTARPFAKKISFDANGSLKGFDMRAITPATKKAIGHIIQSGQLDADLKLHAVNGILDSNITLSLYQFNIKAVNKESAKKLDAKFGMPLNQTLVLLRDKDDSIHLDIPITGDVSNPSFNPMDAIIKATSKAATITLITFYTPYGLIYAGGNLALNLATALNFDPVPFTPGSAELGSSGKKQLDDLAKLLSEKPRVHLTLCGVTNRQDTFALYPKLKEALANKNKEDESNSPTTLTTEQLSTLNQLARDRQVNSKNYLIKQQGIKHDRLILCAPEHKNDDDAIAGVEIII